MKELNRSVVVGKDNYDVVIEEIVEREEFACTGNGCGAAACGIKDV